ncbi:MAG: CRISPR system precrRNA processing endoribonuclease RAMP protein Cas6 [Candidatus Anstonellales archaeon]
MKITVIEAKFIPKTPVHLNEFKGFSIRGAIGQKLRENSCLMGKNKNCKSCNRIEGCAYGYLFELEQRDVKKPLHRMQIPKPYSISPPLEPKKTYFVDEEINFKIMLFGKGNNFLNHLKKAIEKVNSIGKGRKKGYGSVGAKIVNIKEEFVRSIQLKERIRFNFLTPTLLRFENSMVTEPSLQSIGMTMARSFHNTSFFYYSYKPEINFVDFKKKLEKAAICVNKIKKYTSIDRWSEKRNKKERISGIMGSITYSITSLPKETKKLLGLLAGYSNYRGIGKLTTAGMGRVNITSY